MGNNQSQVSKLGHGVITIELCICIARGGYNSAECHDRMGSTVSITHTYTQTTGLVRFHSAANENARRQKRERKQDNDERANDSQEN